MSGFQFSLILNDKLYIRDPQGTELGQRILRNAILLIDEIGFEKFTFRKLAIKISSTEASIYRYFENKHLLFIYLLNWYWEWMKFGIELNTMNIKAPKERLKIALRVIVETAKRNTSIAFIDEDVLHRIVVTEGPKGYHSKSVDEENKEGFFLAYKTLCLKISEMLLAINPKFPYPRSLASTLIETANNTLYFAQHLPRLTDIEHPDPDFEQKVVNMLEHLAFQAIRKPGITQNENGRIWELDHGNSN